MKTSTAVILGGGVIGLSTAYHLARRKFGKIIVVDKGPVGDGSSSRAAGIITGLLWSEPGVLARKKSLSLYRELSEELAPHGYRFNDVQCLNLFDPQSWTEREALLPLYRRLGAPFEILTAAEIRECWPTLTPREDFTGVLDPLGGYSEPHEYIPALTARLRDLGVEFRENEPVTDFILKQDRVVGVKTSKGVIEGDAVICCVYSWTRALIRKAGMDLPVKAFVHQRYVTHPLPQSPRLPAINANPLGGYIRPAHGGRMLMGFETAEREEQRVSADFHMSSLTVDAALRDRHQKTFSTLSAALGAATWESEKVGLLTFAMDGEPILGPVRRIPGFYVAVAFHSGGFAYNPVAGFLMAEYVADGKTSIDIRAFSPDRFDTAETAEYNAATLQQKNVARRRH